LKLEQENMSSAQYGILDQNGKEKSRTNCSLRPRAFIWILPIWISHLAFLFTPTMPASAPQIQLSPDEISWKF